MCGITGFYSFNTIFAESDLQKMTKVLSHRGPDAEGYYCDSTVGLGHTRLSIIDLSTHANQPMHSHCNRYTIVYNGEIYNFKEIAKELDIKLKTTSDTEVILEAFSRWNVNFVHKLNGMFALAIYDKQNKELYLFRDRMGIKPLLYYWDGQNFAFASELKALLLIPKIDKEKKINHRAINEFLYLGYIPEPNTIYDNIHKFPAGNYLKLSKQEFTINPYWKLEKQIKPEVITNYNEAKSQLKKLLISSVSYRLISDVPYGTFLSGGTDSSLVTAIAQSVNNKPIKTFSIGFKEEKYNEANYAKSVADFLRTDHHEFIVSYNDAIPLIDEIITTYDEPYADSSAVPTMLVSKMAKQHVTMTLSGDGGDELFFGYGAYKWAGLLSSPLLQMLKQPTALILSNLPTRFKRASYKFKFDDLSKIKSHIFSQEQYFFTENEINNLLTPEWKKQIQLNEHYNNLTRKLTPAEQQAFFDLKYYLKDDLLVKVDRASMKYSLETRVPLLDYRVVEFSLNLSPKLKIRNSIQKYLLKEVLYDYIPEKYFNRPKWGFAIPLKQWLKNELKYLLDEYLSDEILNQFKIVNTEEVKTLKKRFFNKEDYLYNRLWLLIVLHKWLKKNISI